jgi:hypothetical protein
MGIIWKGAQKVLRKRISCESHFHSFYASIHLYNFMMRNNYNNGSQRLLSLLSLDFFVNEGRKLVRAKMMMMKKMMMGLGVKWREKARILIIADDSKRFCPCTKSLWLVTH